MRSTRLPRISAANSGPKRFHQKRTVSWQISMPRSASRSSTFRSDYPYLTYLINTRRITFGDEPKQRNGLSTYACLSQSTDAVPVALTEAPAGIRPVQRHSRLALSLPVFVQ